MIVIEGELDDMATQSWSVVPPRVNSIKGTPQGKKGKDGKGKTGKGKMEKEKNRATTLQKQKKDASMDNNA